MLLPRYVLFGLLVLAFGVALSAIWGWQQGKNNERHLNEELAQATQEIERALTARLKVYEYRLSGIRGAIHMIGERDISRAQFERYGQARNLDQEYPGARGFGYIRRVSPAQEEEFLARARTDGKPDFQIRQLSPHDGERFVIQYVEPAERNAQAIGLDIASEHKRRYAAVMAASSGQATLTGPISLVQVSGQEQSSFLFLLPVYRSAAVPQAPALRKRELLGWSYAPLVMNEVMGFLDIAPKGLQLKLTDITDSPRGQPIFSSMVSRHPSIQTYTLERPFFGRTWRIEVSANTVFAERLEPTSPLLVFIIGCLASLLMAIIAGVLLLSRDRRQESLATQARLATIVENSSDAIIGEALDGRIITWNHAAEQMFGYSEDYVLGKPLAPLLVPMERFEEDQEMLVQASRGERGSLMETQRLHKDGHLIDVAITCSLIREADGRILGVAKLIHDISDRKRAENYLREFNVTLEQQVSHRTAELSRVAGLLQAVLDASSEVSIIATDLQGQIIVFNRGAELLLGFRAEDMIRRANPRDFHLESEIKARSAELSLEYGVPIQGVDVFHYKADLEGSETREWTYVRKDGSHVPVSMVITPIRIGDGELFGHLGIAHDITERLQISSELHQAKSAAESANAAKSLFLANMSHEIRTPMNAVIGIAHLLNTTQLDGQQRQLLRKLQIAGRSLLGIINDILDIAKIEAGEMRLESRPFSPRQLFDDVAELFATQAQEKGLSFEVEGTKNLPPWLMGDALRINQILMNLIGNALKFTTQGRIDVQVSGEEQASEYYWLNVSVRDTGCGIAADAVDRLFTPFTQADSSTTRRYGGTGLGLSVVRGLTEQMGGSVGVNSLIGHGSNFWLRLPLKLAPASWDSEATNKKLEVWVVDDQKADREQISRLCRRLGWRVVTLESGEKLLSLLHARREQGVCLPDALLVDWQMPGLDGLKTLQQAADQLGLERLPSSLIISAHDQAEIAECDYQHVVDKILPKPVGSSDLFNAVNAGVVRHLGSTERVLQATDLDTGDSRWLEGLRLLLVDDSELNREVGSLLLSQQGALVQTCENGREALERLRSAPTQFDAILMDVQMPEMDGYEATQRIRNDLGLSRLPVIALTAGALAEERRKAEEVGMNDFLTKPLEPVLLIRSLRKAVEAVRGIPITVSTALHEQEPPVDWPLLDGVDLTEAARNVGNDRSMFLSALHHCATEFAEFAEPTNLIELLKIDPTRLAARLHKLRGSVGVLGARGVHEIASRAERLLRIDASDTRLPEILNTLSLNYAALKEQIKPYQEAPPSLPQGQSDEASAEALERLHVQLREQDIAALDQFALAAPALLALADSATVEHVWRAIETLDYPRALQLLNLICQAE